MRLYELYLSERQGAEIIDLKDGFVSFKIQGKECFILDIFVRPELRVQKLGSRLIQMVSEKAKAQGCSFLSATICPQARGATDAMASAIRVGFKIHSAGLNCIIITKELG